MYKPIKYLYPYLEIDSNNQSFMTSVKIHNSFTERLPLIEKMVFDRENCPLFQEENLSVSTLALLQRDIIQRYISRVLYIILKDKNSLINRNKDPHYERMKEFIKFTFHSVFYDPVVNVVGLYYFEKFYEKNKGNIDIINYRPYYALCICLASKMWEDRYLTNKDFLKDFYYLEIFTDDKKVYLSQWNRYELKILKVLDFDLNLTSKELDDFVEKFKILSSIE